MKKSNLHFIECVTEGPDTVMSKGYYGKDFATVMLGSSDSTGTWCRLTDK